MPALTDIGRYKRLAEAFLLAARLNNSVNLEREQLALDCLTDQGLNQRQAERFLENAQTMIERNMLRSIEHTIQQVATCFRRREHAYILSQIQAILEAGEVTDQHQAFFDLCIQHLYHE